MISRADNKYLFIHVMKTGGTSFADVLRANFPKEYSYPAAPMQGEQDVIRKMEAYLNVPSIIEEINRAPSQYQVVCGHFPYATRHLLNEQYVAITVIRDPVSRTISYLKHCRRHHSEHAGLPLEAIYEDPWFNASFIDNYQTKLFSMTPEEAMAETRFGTELPVMPKRSELNSGEVSPSELEALLARGEGRFLLEALAASTGAVKLDANRLDIAKQNLRDTEVVGVTEDYVGLVEHLAGEYGWQAGNIPHKHAGEEDSVSPELRSRIAQDNEMDTELYLYARSRAGTFPASSN